MHWRNSSACYSCSDCAALRNKPGFVTTLTRTQIQSTGGMLPTPASETTTPRTFSDTQSRNFKNCLGHQLAGLHQLVGAFSLGERERAVDDWQHIRAHQRPRIVVQVVHNRSLVISHRVRRGAKAREPGVRTRTFSSSVWDRSVEPVTVSRLSMMRTRLASAAIGPPKKPMMTSLRNTLDHDAIRDTATASLPHCEAVV